jgi:hypothetical protein
LKERLSPYLELVENVLSGLAKVRMDAGAWIDSESEEQARETQVFKIGECLRPFYLAAHEVPEYFANPLLPRDLLLKDTESVLKQLAKIGFFPSPYSPIPGSLDQYTDFAAFVLDFCGLTFEFWKETTAAGKRVAEASQAIAEKAVEFLLSPDNCLVDDNGCRWGGTKKFRRRKRTEELYTDTYFTSVVILGLNKAVDNPSFNLSAPQKEQIRTRVHQGVQWISERFDGKLITGDEGKANRKLLYTTWGLRALVESSNGQAKHVNKRLLEAITNAYLDALREPTQLTQQQEYLTVLSEEVDPPMYYEDRSGLGGILLTLASLGDVPDLEHLLDKAAYPRLLERVFNAVLAHRNPGTGLWYNNQLILSIHSYLTEAFLLLHRRGDGFGGRLDVSGYMVRAAVKETLMDDTVISGLQQAVYDRLLRLLEAADQGQRIEQELAVPSKTNGKDNQQRSVTTAKRSRSRSVHSKKK